MYKILIYLMLIAASLQVGISLEDMLFCNSKACSKRLEKASKDVLKIDWKPISVFPEEAKRFK